MQTIDFKDFNQLFQLFIEFWNLRSEDYYLAGVSDIIFTYKLVDNNVFLPYGESKILKTNYSKPIKYISSKKDSSNTKFGGFKLPHSMDITTWGKCHFIGENKAIVYKNSSSLEYHLRSKNSFIIIKW